MVDPLVRLTNECEYLVDEEASAVFIATCPCLSTTEIPDLSSEKRVALNQATGGR